MLKDLCLLNPVLEEAEDEVDEVESEISDHTDLLTQC